METSRCIERITMDLAGISKTEIFMFRGCRTSPICELYKLCGSVDSLTMERNIHMCQHNETRNTFFFLVCACVHTHYNPSQHSNAYIPRGKFPLTD